ncbi:MAG TPA: AGE family epimerase/isomerase [Caulobacter sp.]|nr:AGE family epimerase/isomerase [Caulobacter sp.]
MRDASSTPAANARLPGASGGGVLYPVIMCGGAGTRLWPASRTERPKPFIPLAGEQPLFSRTLDRLRALQGAASPLIIAGAPHAGLIEAALAEAGMTGDIVIEPEGRDSAPAMAAIAALVQARDPDGVCLFLSADHHIPDPAAFARTVETARRQAVEDGIVTLGVRPAGPATAYGYIRAASAGGSARPVEAFIEKPDTDRAAELIAEGCLWNSGMFICRAATLLAELDRHAPQVAAATRKAVAEARTEEGLLLLGDTFRSAPKISIDFAVMERTDRCFVVPADFAWSDLGAWDAIWEAAARDEDGNSLSGAAVTSRSSGNLVQAAPGIIVALAGVRNLAVIAEPGRVMVSDLAETDVKALVARAEAAAPVAKPDLADLTARLGRWFDTAALPLWWSLGADHRRGGFEELLGLDGRPVAAPRRLRVQARQLSVYAWAGLAGWSGPWRAAVDHGLAVLARVYARPDGLYRALADADGGVLDDTALLYDQAFVLLALAGAAAAGVDPAAREAEALRLLAAVDGAFAHSAGGWREAGPRPFQANAHMHLLEACLAWRMAGADPRWARTADRIAQLALDRFVDPTGGFIREAFDADWNPAPGAEGRIVEPGHQFEWLWLLRQWSAGKHDIAAVARGLYACGASGIDPWRGVACDELDADLHPVRSSARLWPQTERIRAALALAEIDTAQDDALRDDAAAATRALLTYLDVEIAGLFRDRLDLTGRFREEPAPASSLYHIAGAVEALRRASVTAPKSAA